MHRDPPLIFTTSIATVLTKAINNYDFDSLCTDTRFNISGLKANVLTTAINIYD